MEHRLPSLSGLFAMTSVYDSVTFVIFVFFVVNYLFPDSGFQNHVTHGFDLLLGHAREYRQ